jgi:hypothetical protein
MATYNEPVRPLEFLGDEWNPQYSRETVTIAAAAPAMAAGMVMGRITANSQWVPYNNGASDGSEVARGVLLYDVADSASTQSAVVLVRGPAIVKSALLNWNGQAGADVTAGLADLLAAGIVAR